MPRGMFPRTTDTYMPTIEFMREKTQLVQRPRAVYATREVPWRDRGNNMEGLRRMTKPCMCTGRGNGQAIVRFDKTPVAGRTGAFLSEFMVYKKKKYLLGGRLGVEQKWESAREKCQVGRRK